MAPFTTRRVCVLASLAASALAGATYSLTDSIVGYDFYGAFTFETSDPTGGRVNYVTQPIAQLSGLTVATENSFIMGVDDTTVLSPSGPGRNSVRIHSNNQYTTHVAVFDMAHMPQGCGTWPAVWETGLTNWPYDGEVDIVEGVNNVEPNQSTLHTGPGCTIPASGEPQLGTTVTTDCYAYANGNSGCGVKYTQDYNSFGPGFNDIGGGWYAIERTNDYISIWFWERGDASAPSDATSGAPTVNTNNWGTPAAYFPNTLCDLETEFAPNNIIINIELCGDWAGNAAVYASSGCPSDCVDYVNNNPSAFTDAYFQFNSINIYE